jgi:hypothetical protein
MKGILVGAIINTIAILFAVAQSPTLEASGKTEASVAKET